MTAQLGLPQHIMAPLLHGAPAPGTPTAAAAAGQMAAAMPPGTPYGTPYGHMAYKPQVGRSFCTVLAVYRHHATNRDGDVDLQTLIGFSRT